MYIRDLTPMLWTTELQATMEFYTTKLGFTVNNYNADWGWLHMGRDNVNIMFALPNAHEPFEKPLFTGTFYFYSEDVDDLWEQLRNTPFVYYSIENFDYGMREFAIKDNNGYILQFGKHIDAENNTPANNA